MPNLDSKGKNIMGISKNKLKMLYIMKALLQKSDENHVLSSVDLTEILKEHGLSEDRKTMYSDIETLRAFGFDILQNRGGTKAGYYIGAREFELPELKLMVDAVQSSKFITAKKSRELIQKLEKLTSENKANQLRRDVFIFNRVKTGNETIYYNVDEIHRAILSNKKIKFLYTKWTTKKELVPKRDGEYYEVSPWALTWDDENYYLIAYSEKSNAIKHYRVDKMKGTEVIEENRMGKELFDEFDLAIFSKKTFGMYGGYDANVSLICDNNLVGVIMDRFSKETIIVPIDENQFKVKVLVSVSPQFFGWITGLGSGVNIEGPQRVRDEYKQFVKNIINAY